MLISGTLVYQAAVCKLLLLQLDDPFSRSPANVDDGYRGGGSMADVSGLCRQQLLRQQTGAAAHGVYLAAGPVAIHICSNVVASGLVPV